MASGRRELVGVVGMFVGGSVLVAEGLALLGVAWVAVVVLAVVAGGLVLPVVRMTVALQELYAAADMADERNEGVPPGVVALAVEKAVGLSSRYRRAVWRDARLQNQERES